MAEPARLTPAHTSSYVAIVAGEGTATSSPTSTTTQLPAIKSLKRSRADTSQSSSPSFQKSQRFTDDVFAPAPLTGAAALVEQRKQRVQTLADAMSENPGHKALSSLTSASAPPVSRPSDAPSTAASSNSMSAPATRMARSIIIPSNPQPSAITETSPASATSAASASSTVLSAAPSTPAVHSPHILPHPDTLQRQYKPAPPPEHPPGQYDSAHQAFSYPGQAVIQAESRRTQPSRGMSMPTAGVSQSPVPRSPSSSKRHKCPYCETEFTRHHNLKSHLLTHSHEKPFICITCQMRFRRLHDLKRHGKLHTGERPHICPKCDRKFARGDALARHTKGQGGCAGRRPSVGSLAGDDDYDGSQGDENHMDGVIYDEPEQTTEHTSEEDLRRFSLPSIKTQHVSTGSHDSYSSQSRAPSTYPPAGPRPRQSTGGSLYSPGQDHSGSISTSPSDPTTGNHSTNTSISTSHSPSGYNHGPITESPRPLSPSGMQSHQLGHDGGANRQRSPSLTTQFQQQHFGRSTRASPQTTHISPLMGKPLLPSFTILGATIPAPPNFPTAHMHLATNGALPNQGPPVAGSAPGPGYQPPMSGNQHLRGGPGSHGGDGTGGGTGGGAGGDRHHGSGGGSRDSTNMFNMQDGLWQYVQSLEERVRQLTDRVHTLERSDRSSQDMIAQLRHELNGRASAR